MKNLFNLICSLALAFLIGLQVGIWHGRNLERQEIAKELTIIEKDLSSVTLNFQELEKKYRLLEKIMNCESSVRNITGNLAVVGKDFSYFQINSYFHKERALKMGLDIKDPFDNILYAVWLFNKRGTRPWKASQHCWENG